MFTILFTLPRFAGWLAHWYEFLDDPHNKIVRPRQIYKGYTTRNYEVMKGREMKVKEDLDYVIDPKDARREASIKFAKKGQKPLIS